ncbi:MAG: cation transporter [Flavobacteriales bacterium]|nr:cation transporter [Flavobacteriales bacterium]
MRTDKHTLLWVFAINAVFFVAESVAGWLAQSMGLVADGLDMLADAFVYGLALVAIGKSRSAKRRVAPQWLHPDRLGAGGLRRGAAPRLPRRSDARSVDHGGSIALRPGRQPRVPVTASQVEGWRGAHAGVVDLYQHRCQGERGRHRRRSAGTLDRHTLARPCRGDRGIHHGVARRAADTAAVKQKGTPFSFFTLRASPGSSGPDLSTPFGTFLTAMERALRTRY